MPKPPVCFPDYASLCDPRLPQAALDFRLRHSPPMTTDKLLAAVNVTAWLYHDEAGAQGIQVNPNTTIAELIEQFGRAETPDAETGFHSEAHAGQWFKERPQLKVMQIFSERFPCKECRPMLKSYFPGRPWYYYYKWGTWSQDGKQIKRVADVLRFMYGL